MAVLRRRFSRLVVCLIGVVAFLLTGCKIDGTVEFQADGSTKIDLTFEDSDGKMTKIEQTCEDFRVMFLGKVTFIKNPKFEDITPPGGNLTCRVTSNEPFFGNVRFTEKEGTYSLTFPHRNNKGDSSGFKTQILITMPGKIIKSTQGKINGRKVTINNLDFLSRGGSIVSAKSDRTPQNSTSVKDPTGSSSGRSGVSSSGSGGFPVWGWVGVGTGATVGVAVVAFIAGRKRRAAAGARPAVQQEPPPRG
ncbi:hypothetical protein HMPREF0972_00792 [Actinomyces sp. oral taxon 848 str. F0332]|nr:hypothetical protein HMPREF0972_00792 [Actinomyces sp. oral taxon 848 str. F0332]